jgi:hypothetical protein
MEFGKLCEEFHEKVGKDKTVKISVEESELNKKTTNLYSDVREKDLAKSAAVNKHTEIAKILLIPTVNYLASLLELYQNNDDVKAIKSLEKLYKKSFKFPLEHKSLLF